MKHWRDRDRRGLGEGCLIILALIAIIMWAAMTLGPIRKVGATTTHCPSCVRWAVAGHLGFRSGVGTVKYRVLR